MKTTKAGIFLLFCVLLGSSGVRGEVTIAEILGEEEETAPAGIPEVVGPDWTEITCDGNMLVNYEEGWVRFSRNVKVKNQRGTILSDLLVIFTRDNGEKVDRAEARGNVHILTGEREGTGDSLIYYPDEKKAVLIGNAVLRDGQNSVNGQSITFHTDTRDAEIDRADQVEFHPRTEFELDF